MYIRGITENMGIFEPEIAIFQCFEADKIIFLQKSNSYP